MGTSQKPNQWTEISTQNIDFLISRQLCGAEKDTFEEYIKIPTRALFQLASGGNRVGRCYIAIAKYGHCDLYMKGGGKSTLGQTGWPRQIDGYSSGCVKTPDWKKKVRTCYYSTPLYRLSKKEVDSFCGEVGITNAVEMLRHAIDNGACGGSCDGEC